MTGVLVAAAVLAGTGTADARAGTVAAQDRAVQFAADGTTTYGTVHVPAHRAGARLAAALLIPGSGPTDRDGDQPPALVPGTLRLMADALGSDGVMSLRFDKYASGQTGLGQYQGDPAALDLAAFTRQADDAYRVLLAQPEADPHAMLVVGHSEGGMQALLVDRSVRPRPAGLALLAPQDERLLDTVAYQLNTQIDALVKAGVLTAAEGTDNKSGVTRVIAEMRAGEPIDTTGLYAPLATALRGFGGVNARFVASDDAIYPPDVARQVRPGTRVLVTCGTNDFNVPCATTPPLLTALRRAWTTGPGLVTLPGLDHFFHAPGVPVNTQTLDPELLRALNLFDRPWSLSRSR
jgi:pimeloyl-ACP methyl ester carboxylesterase